MVYRENMDAVRIWSLSIYRERERKERHIYPSLVLVQPRKTRTCSTERLLMGLKESNQTVNKQNSMCWLSSCESPYLLIFNCKGKREIYFTRYLAAQIFVGVLTF